MRQLEKFLGDVVGLANEVFGDAVTGNHQKTDVAARLTDLRGDGRFSLRRPFPVGRQVNHRDMKKCHTLDLLCVH